MSLVRVSAVAVPLCLVFLRCSDTATSRWAPPESMAQPALPPSGVPPAPSSSPQLPSDPSGAAGSMSGVSELPPQLAPPPPASSLGRDAGSPGPDAGEPDAAVDPEPPEPPEPPVPPVSVGPSASSTPSSGALPEENFPTPTVPSAGCTALEPAPAAGLASLELGGLPAEYLLTLPDGYDGRRPVPLIFAFHGRARSYLEFAREDATGIERLAARALMVYPQSQGGEGWTHEQELAPNLAFFEALYALVTANYCVDRARTFALGHSSGGFFSQVLACRYGDRLRGIGVVAGAREESACNGFVAALLIHGVRDSVVEFERGVAARDALLARNGCSSESWTSAVEPCRSYTGCEPGLPVVWCPHDEPTYDDTNHGWPSFASRALEDFLFSLP